MQSSVPSDVYIDADVLVNCALRELPNSTECLRATQRLVNSGSIVYFSIITRMEYAQAIRSLVTRRQLSQELHEAFELENWRDVAVRRRWMSHWSEEFEQLLEGMPAVVELPLTVDVLNFGVELMAEHALRSHDAVHLATALHYQIPTFWTCDDHFNRSGGVDVEIIRA